MRVHPHPRFLSPDESSAVPLSYLVRQRQEACAEALRAWFDDVTPPPATVAVGHQDWTRSNQIFKPDVADGDWSFTVTFGYAGFDPSDSSESYGATRTISDHLTTLDDDTILLDNRQGVDVLDVDLTRSVTFAQSRTEETDDKLKIDIGTKVGGTIGGEAEGGTISAEISATFGIEHDTSKIQSESVDRTQTIHLGTHVPVGKALLATISTPNLVTEQDFTVHGAIDGPFTISFISGLAAGRFNQLMRGPRYSGPAPGWNQPDGQECRVQFTSFSDWQDAMNKTNVDFPGLADDGPLASPDQIDAVLSKRWLDWTGHIRREAQESAGYKFAAVDDATADELAGSLPPDRVVLP